MAADQKEKKGQKMKIETYKRPLAMSMLMLGLTKMKTEEKAKYFAVYILTYERLSSSGEDMFLFDLLDRVISVWKESTAMVQVDLDEYPQEHALMAMEFWSAENIDELFTLITRYTPAGTDAEGEKFADDMENFVNYIIEHNPVNNKESIALAKQYAKENPIKATA